jgi:hypothetical protein
MGARLSYAKVIDSNDFLVRGSKLHPGLSNLVTVRREPGVAGPFRVMRAWFKGHGTFTEQWRIKDPGGLSIYESVPREVHLPTREHTERLEDEVSDLQIEYAADGYEVVFSLDEEEVARVHFPVRAQGNPETIDPRV